MTFVRNWRTVLARAWSVRLTVLAAILSGLEVTFSLVTPELLGIQPGLFASLAGLASAAALVARLLVQPVITPPSQIPPEVKP